MDAIPPIKFAQLGDVEIAYQVVGHEGPTLIGTPGFGQNIGLLWDEARAARFLRDLGSFSRFIQFDKRGTGMSARGAPVGSFPDRVRDFEAVLDAEGIDTAFVAGISEGGALAAYFAATQPDRCSGLILYGTACGTNSELLPWAATADEVRAFGRAWLASWGTGEFAVAAAAPSLLGDTDYLAWAARYEVQCLTPRAFAELWEMNITLDLGAVLPSIAVPTTVIHRSGDLLVDVRHGRHLAENIAGARLVELPGSDHLPWVGDVDAVLRAVEEAVGAATVHATDRMLAVVLFTDIVDSTARISEIGDKAWRSQLTEHDRITAAVVTQHRGKVVKSTGDGVLATFLNPSEAIEATEMLHRRLASIGMPVRAGIHAGEIERRGDDVSGIGVHIAARISALAGPGQTKVSSTIRDLTAGTSFRYTDLGMTELKGVSEPWRLFDVTT